MVLPEGVAVEGKVLGVEPGGLRLRVTGFITNDAVFERVETFETLVLERLL